MFGSEKGSTQIRVESKQYDRGIRYWFPSASALIQRNVVGPGASRVGCVGRYTEDITKLMMRYIFDPTPPEPPAAPSRPRDAGTPRRT